MKIIFDTWDQYAHFVKHFCPSDLKIVNIAELNCDFDYFLDGIGDGNCYNKCSECWKKWAELEVK